MFKNRIVTEKELVFGKNMAQKKKITRQTQQQIDAYREYFEAEMNQIARHLREFKANKEEFYRRWSAYSDFDKVQSLLG